MEQIKPRIRYAMLLAGAMMALSASAQDASIDIGTIEQAQRVTLQSSGTGGALLGGAIGYNLGSGNSDSKKRRRAIIGGSIGSAAATNTRPGMEYTVKFGNGSTMAVVSDQLALEVGDCVSVEQTGKTANIRRQDPAACDPNASEAVEDLQDEFVEEANECAAVKQELLEAKTVEQVELATAKAKILCN
jgi:outer membrane lipoprotein SlyB